MPTSSSYPTRCEPGPQLLTSAPPTPVSKAARYPGRLGPQGTSVLLGPWRPFAVAAGRLSTWAGRAAGTRPTEETRGSLAGQEGENRLALPDAERMSVLARFRYRSFG